MKQFIIKHLSGVSLWKHCSRCSDDFNPNNESIPHYTADEAIEAGWTNRQGDDWICPECSQDEETIINTWGII